MWTERDARRSRPYTTELLDMVEQGMVDKDNLISDLLGFMSEQDVKDFCRSNDYIPDEAEEEEAEEEWTPDNADFCDPGSRHHY